MIAIPSVRKPSSKAGIALSALTLLLFAAPGSSQAQFEPIGTPAMPPQGFWAEVVHSTPQWLVVQNAAGQQFPISIQTLEQGYMIRQPIAPQDIPIGAVAEAIGLEGNNGQIMTDHVDFYEGALRQNATFMSRLLLGNGQATDEFWVSYNVSNGFIFPPDEAEAAFPTRRQIVGPVVSVDPLQLARAGNNAHTIIPSPGGIMLTRLSAQNGTFARVQPGDIVFIEPNRVAPFTARSLNPSQLVVYRGFR